MSPSKWGYARIITGTVFGGILGFYVMHRVEENYKEKMKERLAKYEAELNRKAESNQEQFLKEEMGKDKAEILSEGGRVKDVLVRRGDPVVEMEVVADLEFSMYKLWFC